MTSITVSNMQAEPTLTETHTVVKYIKHIEEILKGDDYLIVEKFYETKGDFTKIFLRPDDLSFHNFENIINLDVMTDCNVTNLKKLNDYMETHKKYIEESYNDKRSDNIIIGKLKKYKELLSIDALDMYMLPSNSKSRGGKRMIFHSMELAKSLSANFFEYALDEEIVQDCDNDYNINVDPKSKLKNNKVVNPFGKYKSYKDDLIQESDFNIVENVRIERKNKHLSNKRKQEKKNYFQSLKTELYNIDNEISSLNDKLTILKEKPRSKRFSSLLSRTKDEKKPNTRKEIMEINKNIKHLKSDKNSLDEKILKCEEEVQELSDEESESEWESEEENESEEDESEEDESEEDESEDESEEPEENESNEYIDTFYDDFYTDMEENFDSVNSVFRLNSFSPGDGEFKSHYDTPYVSKSDNTISKYTMLMYLTGGYNPDGCLVINDNVKITRIKAGDVFIFDQTFEHVGRPYIEGKKIFIRTELIFKGLDKYKYDLNAAVLFNKACYFSKESMTKEHEYDLQKYSSDLFNQTMEFRQSIIQITDVERILLYKKYMGFYYVADGHNFYFSNFHSLKDIACVIILDYFNGKIKEIKKYELKDELKSQQIPMKTPSHDKDEIMLKKKISNQDMSDFDIIQNLIDWSFNDEMTNVPNYEDIIEDKSNEEEVNTKEYQCGIGDCTDGTSKNDQEEELYVDKKIFLNKCSGFNVSIFDDKVTVNPESFVIGEKEIICNDAMMNGSINFASCMCSTYSKDEYIYKIHKRVNVFILPNIKYEKINNGYKLSIDMFDNGFVYAKQIDVLETHVNPNFSSRFSSY